MKYIHTAIITLIVCCLSTSLHAERIKDIADVAGVRSNQLVGYGLVVGLPGTGEQSPFTEQSFRTMLSNFGITLPENQKPKIKNVAAVAVHAELPAFAKPGQRIDVTVSSVGSSESLRGGTLLQTFLQGADGEVYAVAQGNLVVSGLGAEGADGSFVLVNTPTVGRISSGAVVEREVISPFSSGDNITFNLRRADFSTAKRMSDAINNIIGPGSAIAKDAISVEVAAPRDVAQRVSYMAMLENIQVTPADGAAKVVVNSRTGTIVIGQNVRLSAAAITHGALTVTISENQSVSQPNPFARRGQTVQTTQSIVDVQQDDSKMFLFDPGVSLDDLVRAVNAIGVSPGDLMAILEALKEAGALQGELIVI